MEQRGVFHTGVDSIGICKRWLKVPDALELPGMGPAVIPHVSARHAFVGEFIADWLKSLAPVARTLHHLPEPPAALRGIDSIVIDRRGFHVVNLPPRKMRAGNIPL